MTILRLLNERKTNLNRLMKLIITESQERSLTENSLSFWVKRRVSEEYLRELIIEALLEFPNLCDVFDDKYDFADAVIEYAIDELLSRFRGKDYSEDSDYDDVMDFLLKTMRNIFGQYLIKKWVDACRNK